MRKSGIVVAALALVAVLTLGAPAQAGLSFQQTVHNEGGDEHASSGDIQTRVQIETNDARIDFEKITSNPIFGGGGYMLFRGSAPKGMFVVNPEKKTYSRFDPAEFGQMMAPMTQGPGPGGPGGQGGGIKMSVDNAKVEKLLEEPGEPMQGYATRHYRYHKVYDLTMDMGMMNMKMITSHDVVEDVWLTEGVHIDAEGLAKVMKGMGAGPMSAEMEKLNALEESKAKGFMLRRVMVDQWKRSGTGMMARMVRGPKEGTTKTTIETSEIHEASIPAPTFAIPAGFTEKQLMMPGATAPDLEHEN